MPQRLAHAVSQKTTLCLQQLKTSDLDLLLSSFLLLVHFFYQNVQNEFQEASHMRTARLPIDFTRVKPARRLMFLYLANDVIQNSKKKGSEFNREFKTAIVDAYKCASKEADEKTRDSMNRMLNIWKERNVFDEELIEKARIGMQRMGQLAKFKAQRAKELEAIKKQQQENGTKEEPEAKAEIKEPAEEKPKKEGPPKKKKK
ncbi:hypothetical protein CAPTEDRAFT_187036, partial [Capitella teleta]